MQGWDCARLQAGDINHMTGRYLFGLSQNSMHGRPRTRRLGWVRENKVFCRAAIFVLQ